MNFDQKQFGSNVMEPDWKNVALRTVCQRIAWPKLSQITFQFGAKTFEQTTFENTIDILILKTLCSKTKEMFIFELISLS